MEFIISLHKQVINIEKVRKVYEENLVLILEVIFFFLQLQAYANQVYFSFED